MGYKGNMFDVQAAILLPQIPKLEENLKKRCKIFERYSAAFRAMAGVALPDLVPATKHARHLFTIWVRARDRDDMIHRLQKRGLGVAVNYRPVHLLTYYREAFGFVAGLFPRAEKIGNQTISLPFYPGMPETDVFRVVEAVRREVAEPAGSLKGS